MIRLQYAVELNYQVQGPGADFIFIIQAAHTRHQHVVNEQLGIGQTLMPQAFADPVTKTRYLRLQAPAGPLRVSYVATVDLAHHLMPSQAVGEVSVVQLPGNVLPYLYPSRYCESDRLLGFATQKFGHLLQGHDRVRAIRDWVQQHVTFKSNTSNSSTSACDTLASGQGVCRDFAHLMIALCRAINIPARFATALDYGADPALGPPDFHAYVEVFLGQRWYLFDPSGTAIPLGLVRIATSRDAADAAFATIFGTVWSEPPRVHIEAVANAQGERVLPRHTMDAISTDADGA
ncbi:MAG: transglutaminase [Betaproteobacteria bacterium HGW-Betaproteobacteria-3]|nr:MAG: transglutaminase [Betaproteobacteria bacterium HGW-Betaproteobacteria-3]